MAQHTDLQGHSRFELVFAKYTVESNTKKIEEIDKEILGVARCFTNQRVQNMISQSKLIDLFHRRDKMALENQRLIKNFGRGVIGEEEEAIPDGGEEPLPTEPSDDDPYAGMPLALNKPPSRVATEHPAPKNPTSQTSSSTKATRNHSTPHPDSTAHEDKQTHEYEDFLLVSSDVEEDPVVVELDPKEFFMYEKTIRRCRVVS
ncbi:hypothetical protein MKZ38_010180 [Zalerion maritima]|uniref:Uncharacterized protein n=1 Tax=Zalerion maritima TaxID=339359 RepID=A0AAD5RG15_9PEZI|nr:hypothetical protein MKZ38_010180 [Zalerion maritima]